MIEFMSFIYIDHRYILICAWHSRVFQRYEAICLHFVTRLKLEYYQQPRFSQTKPSFGPSLAQGEIAGFTKLKVIGGSLRITHNHKLQSITGATARGWWHGRVLGGSRSHRVSQQLKEWCFNCLGMDFLVDKWTRVPGRCTGQCVVSVRRIWTALTDRWRWAIAF